jgi:tetratricopeptide (TPR) repeat protein
VCSESHVNNHPGLDRVALLCVLHWRRGIERLHAFTAPAFTHSDCLYSALRNLRALPWLLAGTFLCQSATAGDLQDCAKPVAIITSVQGQVETLVDPQSAWTPAQLDQRLCGSGQVRTGAYSRAQIRLIQETDSRPDGTLLQLDERTTLALPNPDQPWWIELLEGVTHVLSRTPKDFTIRTRFANARVEGTEFLVHTDAHRTEVSVFEGRVNVANDFGALPVTRGESAVAEAGQAPRREIRLRPRDAVQWALYYPPLIDLRPGRYAPLLQPALTHYRNGRIAEAIAALDSIDVARRDNDYYGVRAGMQLGVGRVELARADLAKMSSATSDATALALQSVIALTTSDRDAALRFAHQSVTVEPRSPVAHIALSYAEQAGFDLDAALAAARKATDLDAENPLAWARVAELELAQGNRARARVAAARATKLDPDLARTHTVSGFAALGRSNAAARSEFERARALDPADPLPRLGLGLTKIRGGDLAAGRQDIEDAANIDPDNAAVRSYLGKAYYEERRDAVAATEFANARALDPLDPTPWFYDAIRKQGANRPVEALHDLERAVALNDNRAVYRSRLALDSDLAARNVTQGQIYRDLGFERLGLLLGWRSLGEDATDYSAHRLLADSYRSTVRNDIGRVSELLQAQLFQPINMVPVQPDALDDTAIGASLRRDSQAMTSDYQSLIQRDGLNLYLGGAAGSQQRLRDEVIHTGLWDTLSYSVGQSHFETDGFRDDSDLSLDAYNAFVQWQPLPLIGLQAEYRHRESDQGNLIQTADDAVVEFFRGSRGETTLDSFRVGARLSPAPHSSLIGSLILLDGERINSFPATEFSEATEDVFDSKGYLAEGRYDFRVSGLQLVAGGGQYSVDTSVVTNPCLFEVCDPFGSNERHGNGYLYSTVNWPRRLSWTLGASLDDYQSELGVKAHKINPKFGAVLELTPATSIRMAYFETLRRALITNQTIEPTVVAGFSQFFDDPTATESSRRGIGIDHRFGEPFRGGLEFSSRLLRVPTFGLDEVSKWREYETLAYLAWTPTPRWSLYAEYRREIFDPDPLGPPATDVRFAPVTISHFRPNGVFFSVRGQYVTQTLEPQDVESTNDDGFFVDLGVGYRMQNRRAVVELLMENLFDDQIRYEGSANRGRGDLFGVPQSLPFSPGRAALLVVRLSL